jgi:hypothetical protein
MVEVGPVDGGVDDCSVVAATGTVADQTCVEVGMQPGQRYWR